MPVETPRHLATEPQRAAARKYGLEVRAASAGWWDARYRSNGRKVQVKSARYRRDSGEPGTFRCWRENLEELEAASGSVVLVVTNPSNPERTVLRVTKRSPSTLLDLGDYRETGQVAMAGKHEARIPWTDVLSL